MKNLTTKLISFILMIAMVFTTTATVFAQDSSNTDYLQVVDEGVYINDVYYSQAEFVTLLDTAIEEETPQTRSAAAIVAGTWWIPGVGQVVVTAAGTILVAGAVVAAGTWLYDVIADWFADMAFNKAFDESAEDAVNNANSNKQHHILDSKHNWNKFNKDPNWNNVGPILIKVLKDGTETWERNDQYIRTLIYKGETVVVRFIKDAEGLIKYLSTAWCE